GLFTLKRLSLMVEEQMEEEQIEYQNQFEIFGMDKIFSVSIGSYKIKKNEIDTEEWSSTNENKQTEKKSKNTTKNMDDSFFKTMDEDYFSMIEEEDLLGYVGEDEK